jgi:hypothetical protein
MLRCVALRCVAVRCVADCPWPQMNSMRKGRVGDWVRGCVRDLMVAHDEQGIGTRHVGAHLHRHRCLLSRAQG